MCEPLHVLQHHCLLGPHQATDAAEILRPIQSSIGSHAAFVVAGADEVCGQSLRLLQHENLLVDVSEQVAIHTVVITVVEVAIVGSLRHLVNFDLQVFVLLEQ